MEAGRRLSGVDSRRFLSTNYAHCPHTLRTVDNRYVRVDKCRIMWITSSVSRESFGGKPAAIVDKSCNCRGSLRSLWIMCIHIHKIRLGICILWKRLNVVINVSTRPTFNPYS
jgi:hypothetical protein